MADMTPENMSTERAQPIDMVALDEVVSFTSDLIRIDTTNRGNGDCEERPAAEYVAERLAAAGLEPTLLERTPGRTNVVARIPGTDPTADALLVHGHLDVVPAEPADWSVHPFSGEVRDGVVWGRGAVDMKNMDAMVLAVVRAWARAGVRPRRDIVIAYTADEEASAIDGSGFLADHHPELFEGCTEGISESGAFTFHAGPGMTLYPVGAGERGTAWLKLTAHGRAGHGSKVNRANAVSRLAAPSPVSATTNGRSGSPRPSAPRSGNWPRSTVSTSTSSPSTSTPTPCSPSSAPPRTWSRRPCATAPTRRSWKPVTRSM